MKGAALQPTKRRIFIGGLVSGAGAQVFSVLVGLISVPIGINYLGPFEYGIWSVISSITAYLSLSQFGVGTASSVIIAKQVDRQFQGRIFRRGFRLLCYFSLFLMILFSIMALFPDGWARLFGEIPYKARQNAIIAAVITVGMYLLRLPTLSFNSAFIGLQELHWEKFYAVIVPISLSFIALLLTIYFSGDLVMLACLTGSAQLLAGLLAGLHFSIRHLDMLMSSKNTPADIAVTKELLSSGSRFFFIGMAAMVVWYTDNLVISFFLGPESVTAYAVTFKLFTAAFSILVLANTVLIPMFGKALASNNWSWISDTYQSALSIMVVLGGLVWIGGVLFAKSIILLWIVESCYVCMLVVIALGGYGYILSTVNLNANLLSGMNATHTLLWIGVAEAIVNFGLSVTFIHWWGVGGVALGTFISALLTVYWLLPKDVERQTHSRVKVSWLPLMGHFVLMVFPGVCAAYFLTSIADGAILWATGTGLCLIYLVISIWFLPQQSKSMLNRLVGEKI